MRKPSVQRRILIWYTAVFVLLILVNLAVVISISSAAIFANAREILTHETEEIAEELRIGDHGPTLGDDEEDDDGFAYFRDNVVFVILNNGVVAYGAMPSDLDGLPAVELYVVRSIQGSNAAEWLVYDVLVDDGYVLRGLYYTSDSKAAFQSMIWLLILVSPLLILISLIGGSTILRRAFRPINAVYQTAEQIKNSEDYALRIAVSSDHDEVSRMARMVNHMLDQMQTAIRREKDFASNVSHELRTPLTVLRSQVEYMQTKTFDAEVQQNLTSIMNQIGSMERMVRQFLELTRAKHIQPDDLETFDLFDMVESVASSMAPMMETKRIDCAIIPPVDSTTVFSYLPAHVQIWTNLISNAIKYNVEGGRIVIRFCEENNRLCIDIEDTGIGMSSEDLARAFDPFYRAEPSRHGVEGLGVGLSITKELVDLLEGSIDLASTPGKGTTVHLSFPASSMKK